MPGSTQLKVVDLSLLVLKGQNLVKRELGAKIGRIMVKSQFRTEGSELKMM
jgi:hypothetical protein